MKVNRPYVIIGLLGVALLAVLAAGWHLRQRSNARISQLETELGTLRQQEKQSAVDRRVSRQMEEIAYGQQALSEERSREAIRQSEIAQEMTLRSESERKKAIEAQNTAEVSAGEAIKAYRLAEQQRQEADEQRRQAVHAKQVTDTLNYLSLARTLGSQSYAIFQAGDTELGNMLAYAAYLYTRDYNGDLFAPAVFQALMQSASGRREFNVHNGSITATQLSGKDHHLLTVSTYGEIFTHRMQGGQMRTTRLMSDKHYCFRDAYAAAGGKDYAVSHTGHLVVTEGQKLKVLTLEGIEQPFALAAMNAGRHLLIVGESSVGLLEMSTDRIIGIRSLDYEVIAVGQRAGKPLLFDNSGHMHLMSTLDDVLTEKVPVAGRVTAFAADTKDRLAAYGMADGTIWLCQPGGKASKLVGHLSQVTKMHFDGNRLYSSSYDGKLLFWMTADPQIKPITLFQTGSWLTDFAFTADKEYIWTGEHSGKVTEYLISLEKIAQRLRQNVRRDFTQEEWDYYVGKGIPMRLLTKE